MCEANVRPRGLPVNRSDFFTMLFPNDALRCTARSSDSTQRSHQSFEGSIDLGPSRHR